MLCVCGKYAVCVWQIYCVFLTTHVCVDQMNKTNVRFSQTEIAWMTPLWGTASPFTLNTMLVYPERDDAKYPHSFLKASAPAKAAVDTKWDRLTALEKPLLPVFLGLVGDTKWLWDCLPVLIELHQELNTGIECID